MDLKRAGLLEWAATIAADAVADVLGPHEYREADPERHVENYVAFRQASCRPVMLPEFSEEQREFLLANMPPINLKHMTDDPESLRDAAARFYRDAVRRVGTVAISARAHASIRTDRRLRVGFASSLLHVDPMISEHYLPALERIDRDRIETFGYGWEVNSRVPNQGWHLRRAEQAVEHLRGAGGATPDAKLASMIEADEIDILVDINGTHVNPQPLLFARQPAPVIVNWYGPSESMGTPVHHYIIGDSTVIPPGMEAHYSEKVLRLPCYTPQPKRPPVTAPMDRHNAKLPADSFVFCNFGGNFKYTPETFATWMEILHAVPKSVLWLWFRSDVPEDKALRHLRASASGAGIDPARIISKPIERKGIYHRAFELADLYLDTWPYNSPNTGADALWMGTPMLTIPGRSFISRTGAAVVRAAGLPECVCNSREVYVRRAVELATTHRSTLQQYRARLLASRETSELFNIDGYVRSLEAALFQMRDEYVAGRRPVPTCSATALSARSTA